MLCLGLKLAARFVQSRLPFVVSLPSAVSVCHSPALAGQVVWSQSFGPSCCSCVLSSRGVSAAAFCPLGLLSHPLLLLFFRLGFFLWRLFRLGLGGCGPVLDPPFFWVGLSFPCPRCFSLAVPTVCCPGSLSFLSSLLGVSFLSLPVFADSLGWLSDFLGSPTSVAWLREVLPCFCVRGLSACPSGAAVPLGSSVLRGSRSS